MGRYVNLLCLVGISVCVTLMVRTAIEKSKWKHPHHRPLEKYFSIGISDGLREAIRYETISYDAHSGKQINHTAFEGLNKMLFKRFPSIFDAPPGWVHHRIIGNYSILVQVRGSDSLLKPYMLCAHLDVVPVDEKLWSHPPFAGYTDDTHVWGRGALDDKHNVLALLESLALRIQRKERPRRGYFIALGHDEEVHGVSGAKTIAKYLKTLKVELNFIMDEGLVVTNNLVPGLDVPVALIGVAEKGYLTVKVKCESRAKHSSIPSRETAITTLSRALSRFTSNAHPAFLTKLQEDLMREAAPYAKFPYDVLFANLWLFRPLISFVMSRDDMIASQMRTTSAVTVIHGGSKENVIPNRAEALVNHRIIPGYSIEEVLKFDRELVKDLPGVTVEVYKKSWSVPIEASPYDDESYGYQQIKKTTKRIYPEAIVAPSLMIANTDTRHYFEANLTTNIFRYTPVLLSREEANTIHGNDERISKLNFRRLADFYLLLTYNCDEPHETQSWRERTEL